MILWSNILIPVASMVITVFATVYTVTERVKNENKEKHKPYLTLNDIQPLDKIDEYKYHFTVVGKNYREQNNISKDEKANEKEYIPVTLLLDNIGYGVASNIKFYDLLTAENLHGDQSQIKEQNQKLFMTFDVAINKEKQVQLKILNKIEDEITASDYCRILCMYQDLNGNVYDFIICINIKSNKTYDFFAYQRTSHSYLKIISENDKQYKKIKKDYSN